MNCTAPDTIHTYWLAKLTALHDWLAAQMSQLLKIGTQPYWQTQDRTNLNMNESKKKHIAVH